MTKRPRFKRNIIYACTTCGKVGPELKSTGLTKSGNPRSPRFVCDDGHNVVKFDSGSEFTRYKELRLLERSGKISDLTLHPKFPLVVSGETIGSWSGDFSYFEGNRHVVEDVKGWMSPTDTNTQLWELKTAIVKATYGVDVEIHR